MPFPAFSLSAFTCLLHSCHSSMRLLYVIFTAFIFLKPSTLLIYIVCQNGLLVLYEVLLWQYPLLLASVFNYVLFPCAGNVLLVAPVPYSSRPSLFIKNRYEYHVCISWHRVLPPSFLLCLRTSKSATVGLPGGEAPWMFIWC